RDHSSVTGVHSRLVLLWQNSVEADLYCTDELTALQAKANGLLEVTALMSGDIPRRNIPGNTFRRAIAWFMSKGAAAGLVSRGEREVDSDTGDDKHVDDAGRAAAALPTNVPRLRSVGELSRVSEEDSTRTRWRKRAPADLFRLPAGSAGTWRPVGVAETLVARTASVTMFRGPRATPPRTRVKPGGAVSTDAAAAAAAVRTAE
ncbi:unnamed protein product, partial [Ectocarpus sp. 6 AP-2014]